MLASLMILFLRRGCQCAVVNEASNSEIVLFYF